MGFGFPIFLWFLPLAGLPVIFHLMMRRRQKRMEFPSVMFFLKADPRMHSKRRIRELLLLLTRILIILVLLLTLARPSLKSVPGIGGQLAVAIVVDNSASMDGQGDRNHTKLELAVIAARDLVDALGEDSRGAIIPLVPDKAIDVPLELSGDKDRLKDFIDRVRRTEARAEPANAFARIRSVFDDAPDGMGRAVHVFTDLHQAAWDHAGYDHNIFDEQIDVVFHRLESPERTGANATIESIKAPQQLMLPGHTYDIEVTIANNSENSAEVRINYEDSLGATSSERVPLEAGTSELMRYPFTPDEPGAHWMMIGIEGDAFRSDNRAGIGFICKTGAEVHFAGERPEYGLFPQAISPTGTGRYTSLRPIYKDTHEMMNFANEDAGRPAMIVSTWRRLGEFTEEQTRTLQNYLHDGGRLFVVPSVEAYTTSPPAPPDWIGASPLQYRSPGELVVAHILDSESDIWQGLRDDDGNVALRYFLMDRFSELEVDEESYNLLAGIGRRRPILARRNFGEGRIFVSGMAFDRDWTAFATDPSGIMVVMLHNIAIAGTSVIRGPENIGVAAGEEIGGIAGPHEPIRIDSLIGDTLNVTFPPGIRPSVARAGAYLLHKGDRTYSLSVRAAPEEAMQKYVEGEKLPFLGDTPHHIAHLSPSRDFRRSLERHFVGLSLFLPLALLLVALWALEGWLATTHKKRSRKIAHGNTDLIEKEPAAAERRKSA